MPSKLKVVGSVLHVWDLDSDALKMEKGKREEGEESGGRDNLNICIDCISFRVLFAFFEQIFECRVKFNSCCHKEISQTAGESREGGAEKGKGEGRGENLVDCRSLLLLQAIF